MDQEQVRAIIRAVFEEENDRLAKTVDAIAIRAVANILTSFGMNEDDRKELRADFIHLRKWRKSVEQAQGFTLRVVLVSIIGGILGAFWLGLKDMINK